MMAAPPSDSAVDALVERLAQDMAQRWQRGEHPLTEEYLERHPELYSCPAAATELIYEELCLRQEYAKPTDGSEVLRRFPQWRAQMQILLDCHEFMEAGSGSPRFPQVGDTLGEFTLLAELGRGAQGRVFLAKQPALADRPVVLKLIPLLGREHLSLARLQHTHIVPLYAVHDYPERLLRALCLPYFGGATLATLLEALGEHPVPRRSGRHLLDALKQAQAAPVAIPQRGQACQFLAHATYVEAVCWIGAFLADALQYAHERGVLHLDLKPGNVLMAADGQPMLLDFHLARGPLTAGTRPPDWLGGTPAYMAPEQRAAYLAVREGRTLPASLDGRADIYALGVLLHELLGGLLPKPGSDLCRLNPSVTRGLADVVAKCLADEAHKRYASAAILAEDLRRHLNHLPLRGVANRSWHERWRKWRWRRPHAPARLALVLLFIVAVPFALLQLERQRDRAQLALGEGRDRFRRHEYPEASAALKRGLLFTDGLPFSNSLKRELTETLNAVESVQAGMELHQFVERARVLAGADPLPRAEAQAVEEHCRAVWQQRGRIAGLLAGPGMAQDTVHDDLLDLALLWSDLRVRMSAKSELAAVRRQVLIVLAEAERLCGPSCVLNQQRQQHAAALGLKTLDPKPQPGDLNFQPRRAWEFDALGRMLLQSGDAARAASYFDRALALAPQDLWANFHKGRCAFQLGHYEQAISAFTVCVALAPDRGWCFYNRGLAYEQAKQLDLALQDYDRALQLDAGLGAAALSRGLLNLQTKQYADAIADLRCALECGANAVAANQGLALAYLAEGDQAAAAAVLRELLRLDPDHKEARTLLERLQLSNRGSK